jgi:murein L,D-transpeptidase YcbB/YkuD
VLESALADGMIEHVLPTLAPRHESYRRLRRAYHLYRAMSDWAPIEGGKSMRIGDRGPRVERLRARLGIAEGDLFDERIDAEVRDVQRHHGLIDDGIVGPKTLAQLNVPRVERLAQIAANLERWRWMPADLGARHLLVNIAAFQVDLVDGEQSTLSMKIVAGKQYTATPFFAANVERVIVNPPWNVPDKIAAEELWPKQRHDPGYFAREHMRVVEGGRIRQDPGPWCALGRIKLDMPNRFNVYLHDTPAKSLFDADVRAFSHGCIRLERPIELAVALTGKTPEEIETLIAKEREIAIPLASPVPVYVLYWTAFVAEDGHVEFRRDVYGRDPRLVAHVTAGR